MSNDVVDLLEDLFAKPEEKKPRVIREATAEELERATLAVNKALETHGLMTYGKFWSYVTQQPKNKFRPSELSFTIKVADQVQAGASALLVNRSCKYGKKAPVEQHVAFLKENGYEQEKIDAVQA